MFGVVPGLRWVSYVRVDAAGDHPRYVAVGISHRVPVERRIPASTAAKLRGRVPFVAGVR